MPRARARRASTPTRRAPARTRRGTCRRSRPRGPRAARTRARGRGCRATAWVSAQRAKTRPDLLVGLDVAGLHEGRPDRGRQRPHALLDEALDRREADLGALGVERLGDAPRDRMVVRDPEDERRLAVEQSHPDPPRVPSRGSLPSGDDGRSAPRRRSAACAASCSTRMASSSSTARRCPARSRRSAASTARGIPFRVVTNFSQFHRDRWRRGSATSGLAIDPDRIITGTSATAAYTRSAHPGRPLFVLAASDARREFDGQHLLTADEADAAPPGTVAAAVIGDAGDELSYRNMDVAFRLVRDGAELLAMHRNPWWLTPKGPTLDAGGVRGGARIRDGSSCAGARQAVAGRVPAGRRGPARPTSAERLPRSAFAMVGDDLRADVAAAKRVGSARDPRPVGQDRPRRRGAGDHRHRRPTRARTAWRTRRHRRDAGRRGRRARLTATSPTLPPATRALP